ncbi:DNA cytosine methyltransferase [Ralstonia pseudosolanacearum]|uniref:DNA cytosine methyltransferase n=1 Tax=Ralstonia pseudosolanacearum TaxID=1310165 RepID=UPI003CF8D898
MHSVSVNVPEVITKELQMARVAGRRKIRLSSNWLPLVGFEAGVRHDVSPIAGHQGLRLTFSPEGRQKVYLRRYSRRKNNPLETVVEIGSQSLLDAGIPGYSERLHFTLRHGEIIIRPLPNHTFSIRHRLRAESNPFAAMVAMTSGIDVRCLMDSGFHIDSVLEYRPHEARDKNDLTETGALNVLANARPRILMNEDISRVDWDTVRGLMAGGPQIAVLHVSLQCDDFSTAKGANIRRQAVEDLSTTRDLAYDALRMVETIRPACIVLENVPGFAMSAEGTLFKLKLRRWGYEVTDAVLMAGQHDGLTRRERYYLVASVFPGFAMPEPGSMRSEAVWPEIEPFLTGCRDVSHTKSLKDGIESGRARLISRDSLIAPTLLKSQARQAKDSIYIDAGDGRYLLPSLDLLRHLNGIPSDVDLRSTSAELASEIIGQSIDYPMHEQVVQALHAHIAANVGRHTVVAMTPRPLSPALLLPNNHEGLAC